MTEQKEDCIKKNKVDDQQLRSQAAPYKEEIIKIWQECKSGIYPSNTKNLFRCISFFAQYAKYLPECTYDILNMCRACLILIENNTSDWDAKVLNKLLVLCTTLMICRKEEQVIRSSCTILIEILSLLPLSILNPIVKTHASTLSFILYKLQNVKTNYTQVQILRVFFLFTQDLPSLRNDVISRNRLVARAPNEVAAALLQCMNKIELENYFITSREFLKLYNTYIVKKIFILSTEGYLVKINDKTVDDHELMCIDFNGRNLTVSFFAPKKIFFNLQSQLLTEYGAQDTDENQMVFVEIECENIEATMKKPHCDKVLLEVEISVAKIMHIKSTNNFEQKIFGLQNIAFVMVDTEAKVRCFLDMFYKRFKSCDRMSFDENNSLVDQESLMSYKTNASMLSNIVPPRNILTNVEESQRVSINQANHAPQTSMNVAQPHIKEKKLDKPNEPVIGENYANVQTDKIVQKDPPKRGRKPTATKTTPTQEQKTTKTRKQTKKINSNDVFESQNVEKMPSFREFMNRKRAERAKAVQKSKSEINNKIDKTEDEVFKVKKPETLLTKKALKPTKQKQIEIFKCNKIKQKEEKSRKRKPTATKVTSTPEQKVMRPKRQATKNISYDKECDSQNSEELPYHEFINQKPITFTQAPQMSKVESRIENNRIEDEIFKKKQPIKKFTENAKKPLKRSRRDAFNDDDDDDSISQELCVRKVLNQVNQVCVTELNDSYLSQQNASILNDTVVSMKFEEDADNGKQQRKSVAAIIKTDQFEEPKIFSIINNLVPYQEPSTKVIKSVENRSSQNRHDSFVKNNEFFFKQHNQLKLKEENKSRIAKWVESSVSSQQNICILSSTGNSMEIEDDDEQINVMDNKDNDDHQHYSSSSEHPEEDSTPHFKYPSKTVQFDEFDPCALFQERSAVLACKFRSKLEKIANREKEIENECEPLIKEMVENHLEHVREAKDQLNLVMQLNKRYTTAKSKLADILQQKDESMKELKIALAKRRHKYESNNQAQLKELIKLKNEVHQSHENLKQEIWRQYVTSIQKKMNNSFKKAFEI